MPQANGGESGQHMSWTQAWSYAKSLPYDLQREMVYTLNLEIYNFLPFATRDVQLEVLEFAPDYVIELFKDKRRKYTKIVDGQEHIGYLPVIPPEVIELLNASRNMKPESRKSKRKGCRGKHHE